MRAKGKREKQKDGGGRERESVHGRQKDASESKPLQKPCKDCNEEN